MSNPRSRLALLLLCGAAAGCGSDSAAPVDGAPTGSQEGSDADASKGASLGLPAAPSELAALAPAFAAACREGYAGDQTRAAFEPTRGGPHGLLFIASDGAAHPLNNIIPEPWRPRSAEDVELVACVGEIEKMPYESCHYLGTSRTVTREQQSLTLRVVSPRSGVAQVSITRGPEPPRCPESTTTWQNEVGDLPDPEQIASDVVDRFVPVPDCGGSRPFASCSQCWRDAEEAWPSSGCGFPLIEASDHLPAVRTGESVALDWKWESFPSALFQPSAGFDWSGSPDAALLTQLAGPSTAFVPDTARSYSFLARARLPDAATGQLVQTRAYSVEARDRPVVQDLLGVTGSAVARLGQSSRFHVTIPGRPEGGYVGESLRWTWLEKPSGSSAAEPSLELASSHWSFLPDVLGTYRVQLEYSDAVGFSEPVSSAPITAIGGPLVSGLVDRQASLGTPLRLEGQATYAVGFPAFHWRLLSVPGGSALTENYFASMDSSSITLVADVAGAYVFEVVVSDNAGQSEPIRFTVTAS